MAIIDPSGFENDKFYRIMRGEDVQEKQIDLWPTFINRLLMEHTLVEAGYPIGITIDEMEDDELFSRYLIIEQLGIARKQMQDLEMQKIQMR